MKLLIDIDDNMYDWVSNGFPDKQDLNELVRIIRKGVVIFSEKETIDYVPRTEYHGELDLTTGNLKLQDNTEIPLLDKRFLTKESEEE